ncbi:hypothetical protein OESDEN_12282 [Oesophagostomum dentatum]|uniref:VWFA domain-containing protein n=1 Tax=Oesophagostomum dentatum TaxID=61180 RepID=A0A0B1SXJ6_OESDE|nr:hypothetical protein OESDEN_12282 [Oesophagostomum dentatum]
MDGRIIDPEKYGAYSEGAVCYNCQSSNSSRAVVFVLDESGTIGEKGWDAQKQLMLQLLDVIGDIKVGLVVISRESYVPIPLDDYKNNADKISSSIVFQTPRLILEIRWKVVQQMEMVQVTHKVARALQGTRTRLLRSRQNLVLG